MGPARIKMTLKVIKWMNNRILKSKYKVHHREEEKSKTLMIKAMKMRVKMVIITMTMTKKMNITKMMKTRMIVGWMIQREKGEKERKRECEHKCLLEGKRSLK